MWFKWHIYLIEIVSALNLVNNRYKYLINRLLAQYCAFLVDTFINMSLAHMPA